MKIGCNRLHGSNIGPVLLHYINVSSVVSFYALILLKLVITRYQHPDKQTHGDGDQLKSISKTLTFLTGAYISFVLPTSFFYKSKIVIAGIVSWYI